jgi:hypothetical protein
MMEDCLIEECMMEKCMVQQWLRGAKRVHGRRVQCGTVGKGCVMEECMVQQRVRDAHGRGVHGTTEGERGTC